MSEQFTVEIPWQAPLDSDRLEQDIVSLQQHIIDSLLVKNSELEAHAGRLENERHIFREQRNKSLIDNSNIQAENERLRLRNRELVAENETLSTSNQSSLTQERHERLLNEGLQELRERHQDDIAHIHDAQHQEIDRLCRTHQQELDSLSGASSEDVERIERAAKVAAKKNVALNDKLAATTKELNEAREQVEMLSATINSATTTMTAMQETVTLADSNYTNMTNIIDEYMTYNAHLISEINTIKRDNVYLSQLKSYQQYTTIYETGTWRVHVLCMPWEHGASNRFEQPLPSHADYPIFNVLNLKDGTGHLAYLDENMDLQIPPLVRDMLPQEFHDQLQAAMRNAPTLDINQAVDRSTRRASNLSAAAEYLDIEWDESAEFVRLAKRMPELVPPEQIEKMNKNIEIVRKFKPRTRQMVERINKRFDSDLTIEFVKVKKEPRKFNTTKKKKRK
jgi:hypothetical protein